jgi:hypothetical protein
MLQSRPPAHNAVSIVINVEAATVSPGTRVTAATTGNKVEAGGFSPRNECEFKSPLGQGF